MSHTIATMRTSTKDQRKNRKRKIFERLERDAARFMTPDQAAKFMCAIRSDLNELMEIGHVEGYQCGKNDQRNLPVHVVTRHYDDNVVVDSAWHNEGDAREREIEIDNDFTSPEYDGWNYASVEEVEVK